MLASDLLETGMDIQFVVTSTIQGVNDHATAAGRHSSTELELLRGCQRGEAQSFDALVRQYSGRLLTVARRLLRNEEDARDAVQDAFLSAFRAFPYFRADAKLSTWLHHIVINAALMKLRATRRHPEISIEVLLPTFDEEGVRSEPVEPLPLTAETALQRQETRAAVRACIDQLPTTYRTVMLLRDIEELDTGETATLLGISVNAVKSRLHRARQALMTLWHTAMTATPETAPGIVQSRHSATCSRQKGRHAMQP